MAWAPRRPEPVAQAGREPRSTSITAPSRTADSRTASPSAIAARPRCTEACDCTAPPATAITRSSGRSPALAAGESGSTMSMNGGVLSRRFGTSAMPRVRCRTAQEGPAATTAGTVPDTMSARIHGPVRQQVSEQSSNHVPEVAARTSLPRRPSSLPCQSTTAPPAEPGIVGRAIEHVHIALKGHLVGRTAGRQRHHGHHHAVLGANTLVSHRHTEQIGERKDPRARRHRRRRLVDERERG